MRAKVDVALTDEFAVTDSSGNPVTGLVDGDFTKQLYNPSGTEVAWSIVPVITELGNGLYRVVFTPNAVGNWLLNIVHATYFPWGKSSNYTIDKADINDIYEVMYGKWKIENDQLKLYKDDNTTLIATFDLKDASGQPNMVDVFEREKT